MACKFEDKINRDKLRRNLQAVFDTEFLSNNQQGYLSWGKEQIKVNKFWWLENSAKRNSDEKWGSWYGDDFSSRASQK